MTTPASRTGASAEDRSARTAVTVFPLLILAAFGVAVLAPAQLSPLSTGTDCALGIIMFGMGLTLTPPDFALVARRPLPVLVGVIAQFAIMPTLAWLLVEGFRLAPALAAGVILVGCAPGGTSSNVISYLARGDVALSVTMTSISTLLAPVMTPLLTRWLAGQYMPVDAGSMARSIVAMVLVPVVGGLLVRLLFGRAVERILPAMPWISVLGICYVVLAVVSASASTILSAGPLVLLVVACHNILGYLLGDDQGRMVGQHDAAAGDPDALSGRQDLAHENGRGRGEVGGRAVVLGEPVAGVAGVIGGAGQGDHLGQGVGAGAPGRDRNEVEDGQHGARRTHARTLRRVPQRESG